MKIDTGEYKNDIIQNISLQMRTGKAGSPGMSSVGIVERITIGVALTNSEEWRTQVLRTLNKITKQMAYPSPLIDDILMLLGKATCFSTLNLKAGYCQSALDEVDK